MNVEIRETFHSEVGKVIFYFNELISELDFNSEDLLVIKQLILKVLSNTTSANILVYETCYEEAHIVLRSAIETVVLIVYLINFPEKTQEYLADCQLLKIKNNFIAYKKTKDELPFIVNGLTITKEELEEEDENKFNLISSKAKEKLLKGAEISEYRFDDITLDKIDKYFSNPRKFKPFFMSLEIMYEDLKQKNYQILKSYDLRQIIFDFYNESSQIAHGCFLDWTFKNEFKKEIKKVYQFFNKTIPIIKCALDKVVNTNPSLKTNESLLKIRESITKLNLIVYGETI